jgi:hypothetical protein
MSLVVSREGVVGGDEDEGGMPLAGGVPPVEGLTVDPGLLADASAGGREKGSRPANTISGDADGVTVGLAVVDGRGDEVGSTGPGEATSSLPPPRNRV